MQLNNLLDTNNIKKLKMHIKYLHSCIVSDNDLIRFKKNEIKIIDKKLLLVNRMIKYINTKNYYIYIFGGFLRHLYEPFSTNKTQHLKRMNILKNSDIDCIIYNPKNPSDINLKYIIKDMENLGLFKINNVSKYKIYCSNGNQSSNQYINFTANFENINIKFDLFSNINSNIFSFIDYDVNSLLLSYDNSLCIRTEYSNKYQYNYYNHNDNELLKTIKNITRKVATLKYKDLLLNKSINFIIANKLLEREIKMLNENYYLPIRINCTEPQGECGICRNKMPNTKTIKVCSCINATQHFCYNCVLSTINNNNYNCPFCRTPMTFSTKSNIDNEVKFPELETKYLNCENSGNNEVIEGNNDYYNRLNFNNNNSYVPGNYINWRPRRAYNNLIINNNNNNN